MGFIPFYYPFPYEECDVYRRCARSGCAPDPWGRGGDAPEGVQGDFVLVDGARHWVQQKKPELVVQHLLVVSREDTLSLEMGTLGPQSIGQFPQTHQASETKGISETDARNRIFCSLCIRDNFVVGFQLRKRIIIPLGVCYIVRYGKLPSFTCKCY